MLLSRILPTLIVVLGVGLLAGLAASTSREVELPSLPAADITSVKATAEQIDAQLALRQAQAGIQPAASTDPLTILRRLSLALCGTVPSLEEIRCFEADTAPDRLERWTAAMLEDNRFVDYFAERLARAFVGVEGGQFVIYRRDRFTEWLRDQLRTHLPYDEMVAEMISGTGVWTGKGEVNFITAAFANDEFDREKLTARTVRAFLGQRMDCAQCHDHPFDSWTQHQFEGLTAHYAQVGLTLMGVHDQQGQLFDLPLEMATDLQSGVISQAMRDIFGQHDARVRDTAQLEQLADDQLWRILETGDDADRLEPRYLVRRTPAGFRVSAAGGEYIVESRETLESRVVDPSVPFHPEWLGTDGSRRDRLAAWVTHPDNTRFDRAIANRVWGLLFGRPFLADRPVDDLPSPERDEYADDTRVLDVLGRDFREHGCDLRRLIQVIAATQAFRMASQVDADEQTRLAILEENWAVFPLVRLRPEQVIGSMLQASSVKTIDQNSHLFVRFLRLVRETDFVREFGDPGESELADRAGTIPQALLRMNGNLASELSGENPLTSPARIARFSSSPERVLENCFLACLARRPTDVERQHFLPQLRKTAPEGVIEDLFWTLYNSPEFSWNH